MTYEQPQSHAQPTQHHARSWVATFLLCTFLGAIGAHRFYLGKVGTGLLQLFTFGGFGVWTLVDWFMIVTGAMRDKNGLELAR